MISSYGIALALLASVSWGAVYVVYEFVLEDVHPVKVMLMGGIFNVLVLGSILLIKGNSLFEVKSLESRSVILLLVAFSVTLLANWAILSSIKELGSATASIIEVCYPIFTILILFLIFGREFGPRFLVGAAFVLIGVSLVISSPKKGSEAPSFTIGGSEQ